MQITTLNKIITLFLTGIFLLVVIFCGLYERLQNTGMFQQSGLAALAGSPSLLLFITVGLLSTALLLGLIVDSLAELTTDRFLRRTKEWPFIMRVLMLKDDADRYLHYRNIIVKKYESLRKDEEERSLGKALSYAVAEFFHTANKETIEWATQHVSTYLLATNYLFIVFVTPLIFWFLTGCPTVICQRLWLTGSIYVIFVCALAHVTLSKFLFSYEVILRDIELTLRKDISKEEGEKKV